MRLPKKHEKRNRMRTTKKDEADTAGKHSEKMITENSNKTTVERVRERERVEDTKKC